MNTAGFRLASPCTENLDTMPRTADGAYLCGKCEREVVDLRRATKKGALAIVDEIRKQGDGSVCARLNVRPDGTPVFAPEPSRLARFVGPMALVGSLAACSPQSRAADPGTTPVAFVGTTQPETEGTNTNGNDTPGTTPTPVTTVQPTTHANTQNVVYPQPDVTPMAGGLAFTGP